MYPRKPKSLLLILLLLCLNATAQQHQKYAHKLALIDSLRQFVTDDLQIDPGADFYTRWARGKDSMAIYLYVSRNDSIAPPDGFKVDFYRYDIEDSALAESARLIAMGYETMVYKTE